MLIPSLRCLIALPFSIAVKPMQRCAVLVCNIFDDDEQEAHYQMGMYTGFTVE